MAGDNAVRGDGTGAAANGTGAEVLVVEDEAMILLLLREAFEAEGLRVATAPDAAAALAALAGPAAAVAVLVTDLNLGPGPDGLAVVAAARRRVPGLRVVFATGTPDAVAGVSLLPGDTVRGKPFDVAVLAAEVRAMVAAALGQGHSAGVV